MLSCDMSEEPGDPSEEWIQAINTNLRSEFSTLRAKDMSSPINVMQDSVRNAIFSSEFESYLKDFYDLEKVTKEEIFRTISEALVESREVLGMNIGFDFGIYHEEPTVDDEGKNRLSYGEALFDTDEGEVRVGVLKVNEWAKQLEDPKLAPFVKDEIRKTIAHEVAHLYISRTDPLMHAKSLEANRKAIEELVFEDYDNDKGEKFVEQFANEYVFYKRGVLS